MGGQFTSGNVSLRQNMLCLALNQFKNSDGTYNSIGGEIQYKTLLGFGTYEWEARMSSSAYLPTDIGNPISGSISGLFNYYNDSTTEIDFETEGNKRNSLIQCTNWKTRSAQQFTKVIANPLPHQEFKRYKFVWTSSKIDFFVNDSLIASHTKNIPTQSAYPMINHWGTNDLDWGGPATEGVRYMWVKSFKYSSL
jgi:hypothetical protein